MPAPLAHRGFNPSVFPPTSWFSELLRLVVLLRRPPCLAGSPPCYLYTCARQASPAYPIPPLGVPGRLNRRPLSGRYSGVIGSTAVIIMHPQGFVSKDSLPIASRSRSRRSSVNFAGKTFCPKKNARSLHDKRPKITEFYLICSKNNFPPNLWGASAPLRRSGRRLLCLCCLPRDTRSLTRRLNNLYE